MDIVYDKNNKVKRIKWRIRKIPNSFLFDRYMSSGKKDKSCYTEILVVSYENTLEFYNSQSCKPKFYDGHLNEDFDITLRPFASSGDCVAIFKDWNSSLYGEYFIIDFNND